MYVYHCKDCNKLFEALVKLKDFDNIVRCPECREEMKRCMSAPYFVIR